MITGLDHFGMMVADLDKEIKFYESLGFMVFKEFEKPAIGARAAMMRKGDDGVELWHFDDPNIEIAQKIKKHSAFACDNIEVDLQTYLDSGYELAIPIDKGTVVKRYAYVKDELGNYIELCEPLDA